MHLRHTAHGGIRLSHLARLYSIRITHTVELCRYLWLLLKNQQPWNDDWFVVRWYIETNYKLVPEGGEFTWSYVVHNILALLRGDSHFLGLLVTKSWCWWKWSRLYIQVLALYVNTRLCTNCGYGWARWRLNAPTIATRLRAAIFATGTCNHWLLTTIYCCTTSVPLYCIVRIGCNEKMTSEVRFLGGGWCPAR